MSAPTPAPGDDRPREGYYPDPSIPGYVRYWNGAAWVPGTSRPAPSDGEPLPAPPGAGAGAGPGAGPDVAGGAGAALPPTVEETGPHFFDEDPQPGGAPRAGVPGPARGAEEAGRADQHGARPEPASAWGADAGRQAGLGADPDHKVVWGAPGTPDPRVAGSAAPASGEPPRDESDPGTVRVTRPGTATPPTGEGTVTFRRPTGPVPPAPSAGTEGTMSIRAIRPKSALRGGGRTAAAQSSVPQPSAPQSPVPQSSAPQPSAPQSPVPQSSVPQQAADPAAPATAPANQQPQPQAQPQPHPQAQPQPQPQTSVPQQGGVPAPVTSGPGGGSPSWAQQVHQLAQPQPGAAAPAPAQQGEGQPVVPWKPVAEDPFLAVARAQAAARPAGLGRRLVARLIDTVALAAVTGAVALPLGTKAADHIDGKIDAAKLSGQKTTVWLLDGTTAGYLGVVLAVLLLFGVVYETLPTAKWGRTLGKKVCGLQVRDIEEHEAPGFAAALRRWLVYSVPGVLVIGVVGVVWCVFDRPWRQCWHDKAANTFVAG